MLEEKGRRRGLTLVSVTPRLSTLSDAELVERCRAGNVEAWNELVERFSRYVYAVAVRGFRLGEQDAEDVFQEVFTRIYTRLDSLRDSAALRPWIAQLTRRVCLDTLSRSGREQPAGDDEAEESADAMVEIEEAMAVRDAMTTLPDACQEILDRFFAQDQSYRTISSELDLPSGTIASRIARCLGKLREELEGRSERSAGSRE
jgi:RNA polymerase sigma-70 factor, ECF subfamily